MKNTVVGRLQPPISCKRKEVVYHISSAPTTALPKFVNNGKPPFAGRQRNIIKRKFTTEFFPNAGEPAADVLTCEEYSDECFWFYLAVLCPSSLVSRGFYTCFRDAPDGKVTDRAYLYCCVIATWRALSSLFACIITPGNAGKCFPLLVRSCRKYE